MIKTDPLTTPAPNRDSSPGRILVVDDDPGIREFLQMLLSSRQHEVSVHPNAADAREYFAKRGGEIDLVLTDLKMPQEDGLSFLQSLFDKDETVVGVLLTGAATTQNAVRAMRAGVFDFISKPFDMSTLEFVVNRALHHRRFLVESRDHQRQIEKLVEVRSRALARALKQLDESFQFTLQALVSMLEAREKATGEHSKRVAEISVILAQALGIEGDELDEIRCGAFLHDIGKVAIPDAILQKPAALDSDEWEVMKTHPEIGYSILSNNQRMAGAADIVYSHHERYDGTGYPRGLRGESIPRGARIFAVADAYDAIRSARPYSPARPPEEALREIRRCRGTHFDPEVVDLLADCQPEIEQFWANELSGGER